MMSLKISARTRNALVFFSALFLLFLGGAATYITTVRLLKAQEWITHTREVQRELSSIGTLISRAGRSRTQFVQSGDASYLREYQAALSDTEHIIGRVEQMTGDNAEQQRNCHRLQSLIDQRVDFMRQSIDLKQTGHSDLEKQTILTGEIVRVASDMDALVVQMQGVEDRLLGDRQTRSEFLSSEAATFFGAALLVAVLLLGVHYYLLNRELQARQQAEMALRRMSARFLEMQDAERRQISRELHDSLGQYLAGAKMNLEMAARVLPPNRQLAECVQILDKALAETRTISHLLHPPLLDEIGFASAAKWYVQGFSERSGISTSLDMPEKFERLPMNIELALFRVLQESLTNIHRHSKSPNAQITVATLPHQVRIDIRDHGKGMSAEALERFQANDGNFGLGLAGMRERVRELGGQIEVQSGPDGTLITTVLPVEKSARKSEPSPAA